MTTVWLRSLRRLVANSVKLIAGTSSVTIGATLLFTLILLVQYPAWPQNSQGSPPIKSYYIRVEPDRGGGESSKPVHPPVFPPIPQGQGSDPTEDIPEALPPLAWNERQILLIVDQDFPDAEARTIAPELEMIEERQADLPSIGARVLLMTLPADRLASAELLDRVERDGKVRRAQFNFVYQPLGEGQSDIAAADYASQVLRVAELHRRARGRGVWIAMIDTPVDTNHAEFSAASIVNESLHTDNSGYGPHGTALASMLVAGSVLKGLAPAARLIAIDAIEPNAKAGNRNIGSSFFVAKAIQRAIDRNAKVVNLGVGSEEKDVLIEQLIESGIADGMIVVAGAGNSGPDGRKSFPAALKNVIAVTAVDKDKSKWRDATDGNYISVSAPGVKVPVAVPNNAYDVHSGTSIASAFVSGIVALLLEKRPGLDAYQIKSLIESTAVDVGDLGKDDRYGAGLIDGVKALEGIETLATTQ